MLEADSTDGKNILEICKKCGAACCRLGGCDVNEAERNKILKAGYPDFFIKIGRGHYEMKSRKGVCPYLAKNNSCLIHKVRPLMCQDWPVDLFWESGKKRFFLNLCPLTPSISKDEIERIKKKLKKIAAGILINCLSASTLSKADLKAIDKRYNKFKTKNLN